ncbi:MAG: DNA-directed RNA polymerase subunit omega [Deltaproteobacteria bacterium]|nr:DNA-directed RNA polymerase subunit omega [Deltaproteobacteria bacterium]MBW2215865.1 DNA-directed RNA polymerase subunit omega [Deltaproteobacteria bacterium]
MARITVEDCLKKVDNRFELIHLSAKRVRQLRKGAEPLVQSKNTDVVISLREIAAGDVFQVDEEEMQNLLIENEESSDYQEIPEQTTEEASTEEETVQDDEPVKE